MISPELLAWAAAIETDRKIHEVRDRVKHTNVGLGRSPGGCRVCGEKEPALDFLGLPHQHVEGLRHNDVAGPDINSGSA